MPLVRIVSSALPVAAVTAAAFAAAALVLAAHPGDARAGVLSKVVSGMKKKAGQDGDDAQHAASGDDDDDTSYDYPSGPADGPGWMSSDEPGVPLVIWTGPYPTASRGTDVSVYAALQAVRDSDGSATVSLLSSYGAFGIAVANTRYFERQMEADGLLTLDLWSITGAYRVGAFGDRERTAVWIRAGVAGAATEGLSAVGLAMGAHAAHNFTHSLGLETEARAVVLQHGIRGLEVRAGVAASFLRLSYRVLKLDDSPALRGPEVGVAFTF